MPTLPPVWWLDDRNAPTNSATVNKEKLDAVIELVGNYTKSDLDKLKELRAAIMEIPGIPAEKP